MFSYYRLADRMTVKKPTKQERPAPPKVKKAYGRVRAFALESNL
jgi:hypothetical protein